MPNRRWSGFRIAGSGGGFPDVRTVIHHFGGDGMDGKTLRAEFSVGVVDQAIEDDVGIRFAGYLLPTVHGKLRSDDRRVCFQGRVIARAMWTTVMYRYGGLKP
jgi:hypothetical protein